MFEDHREVQIDEYETDSDDETENEENLACQESMYYPIQQSSSCICASRLVTVSSKRQLSL